MSGGSRRAAVPVAVVMPAHGRIPEFERALAAVLASDPPPQEVIVVDDRSPQPVTPVVAALLKATASAAQPPVRVLVRDACGGPGAARNDGAAAATAPVILFIDADVVATTATVGQVAAHFAGPAEIEAVFGSYDDHPHATGFIAEYRNLLHHFVHQGASRDAATFWAGCGAIRRETFLKLGGFDCRRFLKPSIEDIDLGYRITDRGGRIVLDPAIQVGHLKAWRFGEMLRTDIFQRAIPWSRLLLTRGSVPVDLNLTASARVSSAAVLLLSLSLASLAVAPLVWGLAGCAAAVAALLALNARFYKFLARVRGVGFMLRALPFHWLYFFYSAAVFTLVLLEVRVLRRRCCET